MIKNGHPTIGLSETETYQNEEIIFESIDKKLVNSKLIDSFDGSILGNDVSNIKLYELENGQFVYIDDLGEMLVTNNIIKEFDQSLGGYPNISPNGPYAMKSLQTSKGDYCYTYGYNIGEKSDNMSLTIGDSGLVLKKGIVENNINIDSADKKELSKIFLQACVERYVGTYTSEVYNELSGNDMSDKVNTQNKGQSFGEEDWHIINAFANTLDNLKDEKIMQEFYRQDAERVAGLFDNDPDKILDNMIMRKGLERQSENYKDIADVKGEFRKSKETENNLKDLVNRGITKKDILKYLLENGKVKASTLEAQQAVIREAKEAQKNRENVSRLFD